MDKDSFKDLITQASDGDAKAFTKLYELIYRDMFYIAYYTLADEKDASAAVLGAARDGFRSVSKLRTQEAFEMFMMKTLCARIKTRCKDYSDDDLEENASQLKASMWRLSYEERICIAMYVSAKLDPGIISAYTGLTKGGVKKRIMSAAEALAIEL